MKKEATLKYKGNKPKTSDEKRGNPKMQGAQNKDLLMKKEATPKIRNRQLTEASFAKLTLEGESDAFWFKLQSRTKATHQTKKLRTVCSPKPASLN
jgi:hypothetical protein